VYYQQLEQQQAGLLQQWPQQPGVPMHHFWLTGAHSRASQVRHWAAASSKDKLICCAPRIF
jgi:hypothetical protein